jgi:hypothetical protein
VGSIDGMHVGLCMLSNKNGLALELQAIDGVLEFAWGRFALGETMICVIQCVAGIAMW